MQQYIEGTPENQLVLCRDGKVLAGLSVEVLQTSPNGPDRSFVCSRTTRWREAAIKMVRRLGLSGFAGLDFMLDHSGKAYLLEMNMRPTQIAHLAFDSSPDLIGTLSEWLLGRKATAVPPCSPSQAIALPPEGIGCTISTPQFRSAYHDVPKHLPAVVEAYREPPTKRTAIAGASLSTGLPYRLHRLAVGCCC